MDRHVFLCKLTARLAFECDEDNQWTNFIKIVVNLDAYYTIIKL
jgi:hypothetical protein